MLNRLIRFLLTEERLLDLGLRPTTQEDLDQQIPIIEFSIEPQWNGILLPPVPAFKHVAEWWKKIPMEIPGGGQAARDQFGAKAMTAKSCIPLLDGMGLGYTMVLAADAFVRTNGDGKNIEVRSGSTFNAISTHSKDQLGDHYPTYPMPAVKFHNPWLIRTRPGYSTLFIPPLNHTAEDRFRCLGAVVDTDTYHRQVNFPGLWFAKEHDGLVRAGTPLVTAIPFKRADVPRDIITRVMTHAERHALDTTARVQNARSNYYTKELREPRK
jgi:hypothetical protein